MKHSNRLIHESSPYLLQHAHNPVDWYPWGDEAFEKARAEGKPVLVSIGYAACHWCHVMERESFENETVATFMNQYFINIKVDREERPDVDAIYMDAVQAITGSGGWPLNVFLTPERKPFYGGTYFPPQRAFSRASWMEVLQGIAQNFQTQRPQIESDAENLTYHLQQSNAFGISSSNAGAVQQQEMDQAFEAIMKQADGQWGGFGRAPKFPQTFAIRFLLRYAHFTGNEKAKAQALLSLDKMAQGGLYDALGGGFARYSTDAEWLAPHFEKMLYDNALLVMAYAEAYQLTGAEKYKTIIEETIAFVQRELMNGEGGFYSALDADSEGEEGRFYVWGFEKVRELLGDDADLFCQFYDVRPGGNWEGKTILFAKEDLETFSKAHALAPEQVAEVLARSKEKLLKERSRRVRPALDDKSLLGWNALMNTACSRAYAATGHEDFKKLALRNMGFILNAFDAGIGALHHTWKNGEAKYPAFLDDYAYLIEALQELAQITGDTVWLEKASSFTQTVLENFGAEEGPLFYFTHAAQQDVLLRKKEVYDGATPSGNAVMAHNLLRLSLVFDKRDWKERGEAMLQAMSSVAFKYPTSFGVWLLGLMEMLKGTNEIAIAGENAMKYLREVLHLFLPHKVIMASQAENEQFPLLQGRFRPGKTGLFLCRDYSCEQPVYDIEAFKNILHANNPYNNNN